MEGPHGNKRIRSGLSDSVEAGGSSQSHGGLASTAGQTKVEVGMGGGLVGGGSPEGEVLSEKVRGGEGEQREWRDMDSDLLARVFPHLRQEDLFEVMLVSRNWEESVRHVSVPWKEVDLVGKWEMGGTEAGKEANQLIRRVLEVAEKVRFPESLGRAKEHILWAAGACGPHLKHVEFCGKCIDPALLSTLLTLSPGLISLVVHGEIRGRNPIHISHQTLEFLEVLCCKARDLTVCCPSLMHLSTDGTKLDRSSLSRDSVIPSLHCPRLMHLNLSSLHHTAGVLQSVAAHAPNLQSLEAEYNMDGGAGEWPEFPSLVKLKLREGLSPQALANMPLLEALDMSALGYHEHFLQICHQRLQTLSISDFRLSDALELACPALLKLTLKDLSGGMLCLDDLNTSCPKLIFLCVKERMTMGEDSEGSDEEAEGPCLELFHETLEEFEACGLPYTSMRFSCPQLTKVELVWQSREYKRLPQLLGECPTVTRLKIDGYKDIPDMHSISRVFPKLRSRQKETIWSRGHIFT